MSREESEVMLDLLRQCWAWFLDDSDHIQFPNQQLENFFLLRGEELRITHTVEWETIVDGEEP